MKNTKWLYIAALCLGLSACISAQDHRNAVRDDTGDKLTVGTVQKEIRVGMSGADVASVLGSPNIVTTDENHRESWIYDKISTEKAYSTSSAGVSALILGGAPITQLALEVLRQGQAEVTLSQIATEVLRGGLPPVKLGQVAVEVLHDSFSMAPPNVNATQFALEILRQGQAAISLSQLAIEVLYGDGAGPPTTMVEPYLWIIT